MAARTGILFAIGLITAVGLGMASEAAFADETSLVPARVGGKALDQLGGLVRVEGATGQELDDVAWALSRYAEAGLDLPPVRFVYHETPEPCERSRGLYTRATRTVAICARGQAEVHRRVLLLHELGHALSFERLDDPARAEFVERWDLPTWNSPDHRWDERGAELAADIIAWGLSMDLLRTSARSICETYADEFARLTGIETAHAGECQSLRVAEVCAC